MSKKRNIFVDEENNPAVTTYRVLQSVFQVVFHTRLKMHNQAKDYFLSILHHFLWWHHTCTPTFLSCDLKKFLRLRSGSYSKTDEWITAKEIRHKDSAILSPDGSINFLHWLPFQHSFVHHRVRSNRTMWWQDVFTLHLFILHCTRSSYRGHYNPLQNRGASRKPLQTKQLY